ncbi:MAG TPA: DoxX family protein [Bacteroidetes bacterium]|nr:DoxX family protein [Bacteroidota bacterium]
MSFILLLIILGILSIGLTYVTAKVWQSSKSWIMSFFQYFIGLLFVVSGFVKAVDPLGTSYKMEEYFQEFQSLFEHTWFSFINPFWHLMENYALVSGIFMIILEMVLGIMLIIGFRPKLTSRLYLILVLFFTVLTGYTYLTGYVPQGTSFWHFSHWGEFHETNMKVTDCGCFGDFIKFSAWHTFLKDIYLLIPGIYFLIRSKDMHQFFNKYIRGLIVGGAVVIISIFNIANSSWNLPMIDFRPFKEGVNIKERMKLENQAASNVTEVAVKLKNRKTGNVVELPSAQYESNMNEYPDSIWSIKDRVYSEPTVPVTEISDLAIEDYEGNDLTDSLLSYNGYSLWIVSSKMKGEPEPYTYNVKDTIYQTDTVFVADTIFVNDSIPYTNKDSFYVTKVIKEINDVEQQGYNYIWDADYLKKFVKYINPLVEKAKKNGIKVVGIAPSTKEMVEDFIKDGGPDIPFYNADDITLKTIIRSNPGVVLLKNGTIIKKWHYKKVPDFETISANYIK